MSMRPHWAVLATACLLGYEAPLGAQQLPVVASQPTPSGQLTSGPTITTEPLPDRRGSPLETLQSLTEGRTTEPEREAEPDEIETDRDSFTPATSLAGRGRLIVESAYSFLDNRGVKETHSVPELILRYGLLDRLELRLGWNYEVGGAGDEIDGADFGEDSFASPGRVLREYTLSYGVKIQVTNQDRWVPQSALILQGFTPTGGSAGTSTATQLVAAYVAGWDFPSRWKFDTAIRYGTASEAGDRFSEWAPSVVVKAPLGERWAIHGEYFGIFSSGKARNYSQHYFSPGVHYLVTSNLEVGVRLGWGLNEQSTRFFTNVGFGWRF